MSISRDSTLILCIEVAQSKLATTGMSKNKIREILNPKTKKIRDEFGPNHEFESMKPGLILHEHFPSLCEGFLNFSHAGYNNLTPIRKDSVLSYFRVLKHREEYAT